MDRDFKREVAKYMYPYIGNMKYNNDIHYNELVKNYGKKEVIQMMEFIRNNGGIINAFSSSLD